MNKIKDFLSSIWSKIKKLRLKKTKISLSTQITFTLVLVFVSFFLLQIILNSQFFHNYYTDREFDIVDETITNYVEHMNSSDNNYHEEMVQFVSSQNAYSVITTKSFRILESTYTNYTIEVFIPASSQTLSIVIPDNMLSFEIGEDVRMTVSPFNNDYFPYEIFREGDLVYQNYNTCEGDSCQTVLGTITDIKRPNNLNYLFTNNLNVQNEINKLSSGNITLSDHSYKDGFWYRSTDGSIDTLVFINELKNWDYIITIVPIEDTNAIVNIISQYNYYVYLTALAIIFLWSFRLSNIISKPIQNIDHVAEDIANLKFDQTANEYKNKETASLSNSINLMSNNLKEALETLNNKNAELEQLYGEQLKQVELKKRLVSSISHELKTPLMIIQVIIQGISDGVIDEQDIQDELATVLEEVNKSSVMIQDLLQIYRLDDKESNLEYVEFNINQEVKNLLLEFDHLIKKQDLEIVYHERNIFLEADKKLINRVISNFLTNAIKYTPIGQKIEIRMDQNDDLFSFEILNYGVNIPNNELDNIWLPFYRGSQTNYTEQKQNGSGIGLYLVKEILHAHMANFDIENTNDAVRAYFQISTKNDSL